MADHSPSIACRSCRLAGITVRQAAEFYARFGGLRPAAAEIGTSRTTLQAFLANHEIPRSHSKANGRTMACPICGDEVRLSGVSRDQQTCGKRACVSEMQGQRSRAATASAKAGRIAESVRLSKSGKAPTEIASALKLHVNTVRLYLRVAARTA